jgi:DNA-binding NarL/FixJ family response regulator
MGQRPSKPNEVEKPPAIRVILADTQSIYRVGIRKILALEDDIRVVAQAENFEQTVAAAARYPADVILFEAGITANHQEAVSDLMQRSPSSKVVVVLVEADESDTVDLLRRGVRGIVSRSISPDLLVKCVRKVAAGETWLDNKGVNWMLDAYRSQAAQLTTPRQKTRLSPKELIIISFVTQGMRNKEIAAEVGTTEQVIKNYLRKVYDKLGVSDRLELALYCIHHQLLKNQPAAKAIQSATSPAPAPSSQVGQPQPGQPQAAQSQSASAQPSPAQSSPGPAATSPLARLAIVGK